MAETLLTVSDVFMVENIYHVFWKLFMPFQSCHLTLQWARHSDKALQIPRLAGNISITHNYHPQRKKSINDLGWNKVWILMKGWPSRILIRGDTFRASLTFLPQIPVETVHCMRAKCRSEWEKKRRNSRGLAKKQQKGKWPWKASQENSNPKTQNVIQVPITQILASLSLSFEI